jgi:hypothetical protein
MLCRARTSLPWYVHPALRYVLPEKICPHAGKASSTLRADAGATDRRAGRAARNHVFVVVSVSIRTAAAEGRQAVVVAAVGTTKRRMAVKPALRLTVPAPSCGAAVWAPASLVGGAAGRNFAGLPPQIVM